MTNGQGRSAVKRIGGAVLMLLGVALIGYGAHYLAENGNCSGTGYSTYGPVARCSGGEGLYITSTFFLGPVLALAGWGLAQLWGTLWPTVCVALGVGLATIRIDKSAAPGAKMFGLAAGICFFALALVSVVVSTRKRLRAKTGLPGTPGPVASPVSTGAAVVTRSAFEPPAPQPPQAIGGFGLDSLDKIARLAQLRDSGALTEEEFEREKAKLLAQM